MIQTEHELADLRPPNDGYTYYWEYGEAVSTVTEAKTLKAVAEWLGTTMTAATNEYRLVDALVAASSAFGKGRWPTSDLSVKGKDRER